MEDVTPPGTPSVASSGPCSPWTHPEDAAAGRLTVRRKRVHWAASPTVRAYEAVAEEEEEKQVTWSEIKRRRQEARQEAEQQHQRSSTRVGMRATHMLKLRCPYV